MNTIERNAFLVGYLDQTADFFQNQGNLTFSQMLREISAEFSCPAPIPMVLYCPNCGLQHIDEPKPVNPVDVLRELAPLAMPGYEIDHSAFDKARDSIGGASWTNQPHRSHLCADCGCIWRPCDVPTEGVESIATEGKADTWPDAHEEIQAIQAHKMAEGFREIGTIKIYASGSDVVTQVALLPGDYRELGKSTKIFIKTS